MSKKQREDIAFRNETIQGFFDRFVQHSETRYMSWVENLRIGDVVDYMMSAVNRADERKN